MLGEHFACPADEFGRGFVARLCHEVDVQEELGAPQTAGDSVLILELEVEHLGHQVVGGMLSAPVDVLGIAITQGVNSFVAELHRLSGFSSHIGV